MISNSSGATSVESPAPMLVTLTTASAKVRVAPSGKVHLKSHSASRPFFMNSPAMKSLPSSPTLRLPETVMVMDLPVMRRRVHPSVVKGVHSSTLLSMDTLNVSMSAMFLKDAVSVLETSTWNWFSRTG